MENQTETRKPTFKELLAQHNISFADFFIACTTVSSTEIAYLYEHNISLEDPLFLMLEKVNEMAGTTYTFHDVSVKGISF